MNGFAEGGATGEQEGARSTQELTDRQQRFAEALRLAHVGSWSWDIANARFEWSDELERLYGLHPGDFEGSYQAFLARVHPEDRDHTVRIITAGLKTSEPFLLEHRIVRPDGAVRMLHTRGEVVWDAHQQPSRLVGCSWDITDSWRQRQELERTVSLLQTTLDSTADGLLVVDKRGRMVALNDRFAQMWRLPPHVTRARDDEAALSIVLEQLSYPEAFVERVRALYAHPEVESYDVLHFKDGRVYERYSRPQRLGDDIIGRVWSFRDVTGRERLLRRAILLAEAGRLLGSLDIEQAAEAVGQLAVPLVGDACALDLFVDEGGPRRLFLISRASDALLPSELPRAALSGYPILFDRDRVSCMSVPLRARETVLGVFSVCAVHGRRYTRDDLTFGEELGARLALAFDNARLYERVSTALKTRDEFLSIAAHELRRPATALRLALQSLRPGNLPLERMQRLIDMADRQVRQMDTFIDELLDVSRIRADHLHLELEEVDLVEVVRDMAQRMSAETAQSGSSLGVTADGQVMGVWDRMRLEQLVGNLLSNAIKFGQRKPIEVEVRRRGDEAVLRVKDQGIGIPPERVQAIFRPFERAVSSRHFGGLGLGLYICRSIVAALGGTIEAQSLLGEGTTMWVRLPVHPVEPSERESSSANGQKVGTTSMARVP